ncbi:MAG: MCE family protein, partial [Deinococcus-Thermus bacterium]|nr:MCE family protein [Deinococcota bacterium]
MSGPADVPEAEVEPARRSLWERVSIVWLVPFGALLLALGMAWQAYSDRGPLIEISFRNGSGIAANETVLQFRDIEVGRVEQVGFTEGLGQVLVSVRLDEDVAPYVDEGAEFWVVRPEVTAQGIQGLNTVLSGVYIEGSWDTEPGGLVARHEGRNQVPVARPDQEGARLVLRSEDGRGLTAGAPILYKGLEVGRVGAPRIASDGITVLADAFIEAPYDAIVTDRTRFWTASGFSLDLGPQGASLNFASLSSLVRGGLSFDTAVSGGESVPDGAAFDIYTDRETAVASLFAEENASAPRLNVTAIFGDNVAGLSTGAAVKLRGLDIGEVVDLDGQVDPERFGDSRIRLVTTLSIRLDALSMGPVAEPAAPETREEVLDFLERRVAEGLRARLTNASLFAGGLEVELVEIEDPGFAELDRDATPFPVMPTAPAAVEDVAGAAQGLIARINALPVEEVMANAVSFLEGATALVEDGAIQRAGGEVVGLVEEMRAVVGSDSVQALPGQIGTIAEDLSAALARLEAEQGIARLVRAVEQAGLAAEEVGAAVEGVPALVERIDAVAAKAEGLALERLVEEAGALVTDARGIVGTEAAQALPGRLSDSLAGLDAAVADAGLILGDLESQGAVDRLTEALVEAAEAAEDVSLSVEDVPALVTRIEAVAARAETLEVEALIDEATALARAGRDVLGTEDAQALPGRLGGTLEELEAALAELRAGGTVENVNATLDSARRAADSVAATTEELPGLVDRTAEVLARAEAVLAGLGEAGTLNREARTALREVGRAAEAVRSLARTIERRPNSILTG